MAWDFETEPEFEAKHDYIPDFLIALGELAENCMRKRMISVRPLFADRL